MIRVFGEWCFWAAAGLLAYAYVVYPVLLLAAGRLVAKGRAAFAWPSWPHVVVVIAAHDEEKHIAGRIRNLLDQDYPPEKLTVLIGSDGSTDGTVAQALAAGGSRVVVRDFPMRRGKASVLNDLLAESRQPVMVFTDANTLFEHGAVRNLVAPLADPSIGAVCGHLVLTKPRAGNNADDGYWQVETLLKKSESDIDGLLGANGGIYAVRRQLVTRLRPDTICDDFVISMNVALTGLRVVYESRARAHEQTPPDLRAEFRRRVRIGLGNYQALARQTSYLTSMNWSRRWTYLSHKVMRWLTPHLLVLMYLGSLAGLPDPACAWFLALQTAAYAAAGIVYATRRAFAWPGFLRVLCLFCAVNVAFAVAFVRFVGGATTTGWQRTER